MMWRTPYPSAPSARDTAIIDKMNNSVLIWLRKSRNYSGIIEWGKILSDRNLPVKCPKHIPV